MSLYHFTHPVTLDALAPLIVGTAVAGLGLIVLIRERAVFDSVMFFLMTLVGAVWLWSHVPLYSTSSEWVALRWAKIENVAVAFIPSAVTWFTLAVVDQLRRFRLLAWGSLFLSLIFAGSILGTDRFIAGVYDYPWGYFARYGPWSIPFLIFFFALMAFNLCRYGLELRRADTTIRKRRLKALLIAFSIAYLGSVDYLPAFGIPVYPIGYLFVFGFVWIAAQTIWVYRLGETATLFATEQILRTMSDALLVLDREGIIRTANHAASNLFGLAEPRLVGKSIWSVHPDLFLVDRFEKLLRTPVIHGFEAAYPSPNRGNVFLDISISSILDRNDKPVGLVCIARDVTERKQAEEKLRQTELHLIHAAKMESVGRLAAGVAHEVKNPLAVILQGLSYLSKHLPVPLQGEPVMVLNYAKDAVRRADTVIRGLLDFSTQQDLAIASEDIGRVLEEALLLVKHELDKRHIELVKEYGSGLPPVWIDKNKIEQVFVNLLINAAHAMPGGGILTVRTLPESPGVLVEVEDTGAGISEEILPKIFDPFFTTKPTGMGTGLGLAVTKNILEMHHGSIDVRNKETGGVKVSILLKGGERRTNGECQVEADYDRGGRRAVGPSDEDGAGEPGV